MKEIEEIAITAGLNASAKILDIYESGYEVNYKSDNSPVTIADVESSNIITEILSATGLPIISEEAEIPSFGERTKYSSYFLIDPLDGTKEFVNRTGEFCVNIALVENNIPTFGLIADPCNSEIIYGGVYSGKVEMSRVNLSDHSLFDTKMINTPSISEEEGNIIITSRRSNKSKLTDFLNQDLGIEKFSFVMKGSALKFVDLALGKADIYPRFGNTMEWDIAPGFAILNQLNGSMTELKTGNTMKFNKENLLNPPFIAYNKKLNE